MYQRGDIVAIHFPFTDGSGVKLRPALVLSNTSIDDTGDVVLVMITSSVRAVDIKIELTDEKVSEPFPKNSYVKCHRLFTIHHSLLLGKFSSANSSCMDEVMKAVVKIIGDK